MIQIRIRKCEILLIIPDRGIFSNGGRTSVIPQTKKQKRVGRFFWKNLEAKPLNFEIA